MRGCAIGRPAKRASCAGQELTWEPLYTPSAITPMLMLVPIATYRWNTPRPSLAWNDGSPAAMRGGVAGESAHAATNATSGTTKRRCLGIHELPVAEGSHNTSTNRDSLG